MIFYIQRNKKALKARIGLVFNAFFGQKRVYFFKSISSVTPSLVTVTRVLQSPFP